MSNLTAFPKERLCLMIILGKPDLMNIHVPNWNSLPLSSSNQSFGFLCLFYHVLSAPCREAGWQTKVNTQNYLFRPDLLSWTKLCSSIAIFGSTQMLSGLNRWVPKLIVYLNCFRSCVQTLRTPVTICRVFSGLSICNVIKISGSRDIGILTGHFPHWCLVSGTDKEHL